jgi:hypothetical protein
MGFSQTFFSGAPLVRAGLDVAESDLFTSLSAARSYLAAQPHLRPLLLMEEEAQQGELQYTAT